MIDMVGKVRRAAWRVLPGAWQSGLKGWYYRGEGMACPCCGGCFRRFESFGVVRRANAKCPDCGSLERDRLLLLFLRERTELFERALKVLHFAPEPAFKAIFAEQGHLDYLSADLASASAMAHFDICKIPYGPATFDVILCSHVLEHVEDDRQAMREMYRVLRGGGWAILQVPLYRDQAETYEDCSIVSESDRLGHFGHVSHVRRYGRDYVERLRGAGFFVDGVPLAKELGEAAVRRWGLIEEDEIYFCRKPVGRTGVYTQWV